MCSSKLCDIIRENYKEKEVFEQMDIFTRIIFWMDMQKNNNDIYYHVARTILENKDRVAHMGIEELAEICYTSPATISRFCRKLSVGSFSEFKNLLKIYNEYALQEVMFTDNEIEKIHEDRQVLTDKTFPMSIEALTKTAELLDTDNIDEISSLLARANHIAIFGSIYSQLVARDCQYKFIRLGKFTTAFTDTSDQIDDSEKLDNKDAAIIFSVSGNQRFLLAIVDNLKQSKTPLIVITNKVNSSLAKAADYVIELGGVESDFTQSSTSGRIASMGIVDLLYTNLAYQMLYKK